MTTISAEVCLEGLKTRFGTDEYVFLSGVRNRAGFSATREADALAMGVWPSRGLLLHGFEVKVARGDWLRELRRPAKAEVVAAYCDFWWLVTPKGTSVVEDVAEVPATWGWIEIEGNTRFRCVTRRKAERTEATPLDRSFLAAALKRARDLLGRNTDAELAAAAARARQDALEEARRLDTLRVEHVTRELEELRASVRAFEEASGISLTSWSSRWKPIAQALGELVNHDDRYILSRLREWSARAAQQRDACEAAIASLEAAETTP